MDRRHFLTGLTGALIFPRLARSQSSDVTRLNDSLSLVNAGTNVLVQATPEGLLLVDSGAPSFTAALLKQLGSKHVQTLFNTHYHLENTGANEALGAAGARILAHESTR